MEIETVLSVDTNTAASAKGASKSHNSLSVSNSSAVIGDGALRLLIKMVYGHFLN